MSLDKILQALEAEAAQEIAEIERAAEAEIARMREEAGERAAAARHKHAPALAAPLHAERARILNRAKLEAQRTVMGTREELMGAAVDAAAADLAALSGSETYAVALEGMTCEAVAALGQNHELLLRVETRDHPVMERIVERLHLQARIEDDVTAVGDDGGNCAGGVVAMTADGRIALDNSLAVRLQRVAAIHRSEIAAMLFDESGDLG